MLINHILYVCSGSSNSTSLLRFGTFSWIVNLFILLTFTIHWVNEIHLTHSVARTACRTKVDTKRFFGFQVVRLIVFSSKMLQHAQVYELFNLLKKEITGIGKSNF